MDHIALYTKLLLESTNTGHLYLIQDEELIQIMLLEKRFELTLLHSNSNYQSATLPSVLSHQCDAFDILGTQLLINCVVKILGLSDLNMMEGMLNKDNG